MANGNRLCKAAEVIGELTSLANASQASLLSRFFKTGKGEYGEGDVFLGLKVPQTRSIARKYRLLLDLEEIKVLIYNEYHEVRLCGFMLLVFEMESATPKGGKDNPVRSETRNRIANFYLENARQANNWDLVDLSCYKVLGPWLLNMGRMDDIPSYDALLDLTKSENLWEQRIAVVSTMAFLRKGYLLPTLHICEILLSHKHDLMHKAVGWLLREAGKKDEQALLTFLDKHHSKMSRTTLRYAIEKLPEDLRQHYLHLGK